MLYQLSQGDQKISSKNAFAYKRKKIKSVHLKSRVLLVQNLEKIADRWTLNT